MSDDEEIEDDEPPDISAIRLAQRVREEPSIRHFPFLGGWAIVLLPMDLLPSRTVARVYLGTFFGFTSEELIDLRSRRLTMEGELERTWWVIAITPEAVRRRSKSGRKPPAIT